MHSTTLGPLVNPSVMVFMNRLLLATGKTTT